MSSNAKYNAERREARRARNERAANEAVAVAVSRACNPRGDYDGTVYFVRAIGSEFMKIGWTRDCAINRMCDLQVGCPYELRLAAELTGSLNVEYRLQQRFAGLHVRGEWFLFDGDLAAFVSVVGETGRWP